MENAKLILVNKTKKSMAIPGKIDENLQRWKEFLSLNSVML